MFDKRVVIAALARDCADALRINIPRIEDLRKNFKESTVIIIENDSKDDTKNILHKWEERSSNVHIESNDYGTITIPASPHNGKLPTTSYHRIGKMAQYRNQYIDIVQKRKIESDYLIIIDVDIEYFSIDGIINSLKHAPKDWGALFAYGISKTNRLNMNRFYDIFAFLEKGVAISDINLSANLLWKLQRKLSLVIPFYKYYPCNSAFGGLAIYKSKAIKKLKYECIKNNINNNIECLCEHVPMNYQITQRGYNNYISRSMKVRYSVTCNWITHILSFFLSHKQYTQLKKLLWNNPNNN